jgi:hypothetical protein
MLNMLMRIDVKEKIWEIHHNKYPKITKMAGNLRRHFPNHNEIRDDFPRKKKRRDLEEERKARLAINNEEQTENEFAFT